MKKRKTIKKYEQRVKIIYDMDREMKSIKKNGLFPKLASARLPFLDIRKRIDYCMRTSII